MHNVEAWFHEEKALVQEAVAKSNLELRLRRPNERAERHSRVDLRVVTSTHRNPRPSLPAAGMR